MDIDIKKNGKLTLKDTPYFEPIDNTNISFTNMDVGTAKITFRIMKHGLPLQVSEKNVYVYAYLESSNGSRAEVIDLNFDDPINGLVSLQLDKEFLAAATNTTVTGQLYITMHKWNTVPDDFSDTVALQEFTFTVKDALVNKISGVTKIQYIRTFDQLKTEVKDRILALEEEVGRIETVSAELKELFRTTTQDIENLKARTISELDEKVASSSSEVDDKKTSTLSDLDTATTNAINQINNKKEEVLQLVSDNNLVTNDAFTDFQNDIQESIDETLEEYKSQVNTIYDDFQSTLDNLNWQKYKLTEDAGNAFQVTDINFDTIDVDLKPGFYWVSGGTNKPVERNGFLNVRQGTTSNSYMKVIFEPYDSNEIYVRNKNGANGWSEWSLISSNQNDTGWVPFQLINGAAANTAFKYDTDNGFDCAYRTEKRGDVTEKSIRINASKVSNLQQIAQLPENFVKNVQFHYVRVPINQGYGLVGIFPSGSVYVYIETDKRDSWDSTSQSYYFYGEFSFKE